MPNPRLGEATVLVQRTFIHVIEDAEHEITLPVVLPSLFSIPAQLQGRWRAWGPGPAFAFVVGAETLSGTGSFARRKQSVERHMPRVDLRDSVLPPKERVKKVIVQ